jgi:hypothetical protein
MLSSQSPLQESDDNSSKFYRLFSVATTIRSSEGSEGGSKGLNKLASRPSYSYILLVQGCSSESLNFRQSLYDVAIKYPLHQKWKFVFLFWDLFWKEQEGPGPYCGDILQGKKKLQSPKEKEGKTNLKKQTNWREKITERLVWLAKIAKQG